MIRFASRIKRVEQGLRERLPKRIAVIRLNYGDDAAEALQEHCREKGIDPNEINSTIFINLFAKDWQPPGKPNTDQEIEKLVSGLQRDGFSLPQIAEMIKEPSAIPERPAAVQNNRLEVEPMRADEVSVLFKKRGFKR